MAFNIKLESLKELEYVCQCAEIGLKTNKIHPDERNQVKKIVEKLRNDFEKLSDLEKDKELNYLFSKLH